jgi:hypothetical protein
MGSSSAIASYHLTGISGVASRRGVESKGEFYEAGVVVDFVPESVDAELDEDSEVEVFAAGSDAAGLASDELLVSAGLLSGELLAAFGA